LVFQLLEDKFIFWIRNSLGYTNQPKKTTTIQTNLTNQHNNKHHNNLQSKKDHCNQ
jgi:hypothetical protein